MPEETADIDLVRLLRRFTVESGRFVDLFGEAHGLHRTDLNAMAVILDAGLRGESVTPGRVAEALRLSPSATTAALDRLEAAGHLRRARDPADRRRVALELPERARELGARFFQPLAREYAEAWRDFDERERAVIARFLAASVEATERAHADMPGPGPSGRRAAPNHGMNRRRE